MKILFVCSSGLSTSLLVRKMEEYWLSQQEKLYAKAVGLYEYEDVYQDYDIILIGPQVSYCLDEIKENTGLPCDTISPFDYAVANCHNIMQLAKQLYSQK